MGEIIFYKLNGTVKDRTAITEENLAKCNGMKLRCLLKDGSDLVGFADVFRSHMKNEFDNKIHDYFYLWTFDSLNEEQHRLVGSGDDKYKQTFSRVNIKDIIKIEAILHSNPRWGTSLTNQFLFIE